MASEAEPLYLLSTGVWHWRTHTEAEDELICLVSAGALVATMCAECTHGYKLHFH
jgi:hypothetical protein